MKDEERLLREKFVQSIKEMLEVNFNVCTDEILKENTIRNHLKSLQTEMVRLLDCFSEEIESISDNSAVPDYLKNKLTAFIQNELFGKQNYLKTRCSISEEAFIEKVKEKVDVFFDAYFNIPA